jgi:hypothetical protein
MEIIIERLETVQVKRKVNLTAEGAAQLLAQIQKVGVYLFHH